MAKIKMPSYTLDNTLLNSFIQRDNQSALEFIKSEESDLFLQRTGFTFNNAVGVNQTGNLYIDMIKSPYIGHQIDRQQPGFDQANQIYNAEAARKNVARMLPKKTGNLRDNAFKYNKVKNNYKLYIDYKVAPYAQYPNVKKIIDSNWSSINKRFQDQIAQKQATQGGVFNNPNAVRMDANKDLARWRDDKHILMAYNPHERNGKTVHSWGIFDINMYTPPQVNEF
jgi:hypothetical protein